MRVHYISSWKDKSGYGVAARNYLNAMIKQEQLDLSAEAVSFEGEKVQLHLLKDILPLEKSGEDARVRIIHLTPENFPVYRRPKAYNIGYTVWETSKLPSAWVALCNHLQEIWTASDWNVEIFKKSGVAVPIKKLVHGFTSYEGIKPLDIVPGQFLFYSIGQWIARKNFKGLLIAYLTEFKADENVALLLKTYRQNTSPAEQDIIRNEVRLLKDSLNLPEYPKLMFLKDALSSEDILRLHARGDCFVLPTRGEAFSQTHAEALSFGKPVIGPNYGGNLEFMNQENSFLIDCDMTPVRGMTWMKNYNAHMDWAEPSISHLKKLMRYVYNNQEEAKNRALQGQRLIREKFSWDATGRWIAQRLQELEVCK